MAVIDIDGGRLWRIILRGRVGRQTGVSANTPVCLSAPKTHGAGGREVAAACFSGWTRSHQPQQHEISNPEIAATNGKCNPQLYKSIDSRNLGGPIMSPNSRGRNGLTHLGL